MTASHNLPGINVSILSIFYLIVIGHLLPGVFSQNQHYIDLSHPYDMNTIQWPGGEPFGYTKQTAQYIPPKNNWYAANDFKTAEHCGTHLDAPYHFNKQGWKVADIPIERLITIGAFVNASLETNGNPNYKLPVTKLIEWEQEHGPFPPNSVILISFGWASRYGNREAYLGANGVLSFPGLSKEAAEWIVAKKGVVGVGVDTASIDQGTNTDVHITLFEQNIYGLEHIQINKDSPLPPKFKLVAMPMKLANGTGAPCRITAIIDKP